MLKKLFGVLILAGLTFACSAREVGANDPFGRPTFANLPICPPCITPSYASPMVPISVREQSSDKSEPASMQGSGSSQAPPIALDGRPGTGLGLPTGLLVPSKTDVVHQIDPKAAALLAQLMDAAGKLSLPKVEVPISPTLNPETSRSLSQLSDRISLLSWLGSGLLTIFGAGKLGQWAVLAVSGLQSFIAARSQASQTSPGTLELRSLLRELLEGKAAVPSSIPPQGS